MSEAGLNNRAQSKCYCTQVGNGHKFSLLEVIVVLVVVASILGVVTPKIGGVSSRMLKSNAIKTVNSAFHMASSIASATGNPTTLTFDFTKDRILVERSSTSTSNSFPEFSESEQSGSIFDDLRQFHLPKGTERDPDSFLQDFGDSHLEFRFFPNGEASGPELIMLIEGNLKLTLDVDRLTGRPMITTYEE